VLAFSQDTGMCVVVNAAGRDVLDLLVSKGLLGESAATPNAQETSSSSVDGLSAVYLHLTNRCNLSCAYCYNAGYRRDRDARDELTAREIRDCLDAVSAAGATQVVFTGGEPLLRPDCLDLAQYARGLGLETSLLTNGTRVRGRAARIASVFSPVIVSLDSWRPEEHERLRGKGSFAVIVDGIRELADAGAALYLRAVVTCENVRSLPEFPCYAASHLGCTNFMLAPCIPTSLEHAAGLTLTPAPNEYLSALDAFHRVLEEVGGTSNYDTEAFRSDGNCGAGCNILSISADGDVFPCQCLHRAELCAGNVRKMPLDRILQRAATAPDVCRRSAAEFRACAECPVSRLCGLKCWALLAGFRGDEEAFIERLCPMAHAEIEHRLWKQAGRILSEQPAGS